MDVRTPEDLYGLPLEDFTAARNELAAKLKEEGRADESARVKKLKKPPVSAWAVNQLARDDPDGIAKLLDLVDRLKEARSATDIHDLGAQRRELVAKLTRRAGELAEAAGHAASPSTLQRVTQTLQAGDEQEERELLVKGALPDDLEPAGFDAFGSLDAFSFEAPSEDEGDDDEAAALEQLKRVAAEAEEEAARLTEEAERAEAAALAASEKASEARRRAREAREAAQKAARSAR